MDGYEDGWRYLWLKREREIWKCERMMVLWRRGGGWAEGEDDNS